MTTASGMRRNSRLNYTIWSTKNYANHLILIQTSIKVGEKNLRWESVDHYIINYYTLHIVPSHNYVNTIRVIVYNFHLKHSSCSFLLVPLIQSSDQTSPLILNLYTLIQVYLIETIRVRQISYDTIRMCFQTIHGGHHGTGFYFEIEILLIIFLLFFLRMFCFARFHCCYYYIYVRFYGRIILLRVVRRRLEKRS